MHGATIRWVAMVTLVMLAALPATRTLCTTFCAMHDTKVGAEHCEQSSALGTDNLKGDEVDPCNTIGPTHAATVTSLSAQMAPLSLRGIFVSALFFPPMTRQRLGFAKSLEHAVDPPGASLPLRI